jgi:DNA-directed RNA polymerase subunit K/omega
MEPQLLESLLTKVEGKFKLVSLFQKRTRELLRGLPPLVEADSERSQKDVVADEILNGKVELLVGEDATQFRKELAAKEEGVDDAVPALESPAEPAAKATEKEKEKEKEEVGS